MYQTTPISSKALVSALDNNDTSLDVLLVEENNFINAQLLLSQEHGLTLVTLDPSDLHSQMSILQGLYQVLYEVLPSGNEDALELVELIEDELGELNSCMLVVKDFSACDIDSQASLLELVIVSKAFKLLLTLDQSYDFSDNAALWDVLSDRTRMLQDDAVISDVKNEVLFEKNNSVQLESDFEDDFESDGFESDDFESNEIESSEFEGDEFESDEFESDDSFDPQATQQLEAYQETNIEPDETSEKSNKAPVIWYQLIPKYHLAVVVLLSLVVFALWKMDLNETKEQTLALDISTNNKVRLDSAEAIQLINKEEAVQAEQEIIVKPETVISSTQSARLKETEPENKSEDSYGSSISTSELLVKSEPELQKSTESIVAPINNSDAKKSTEDLTQKITEEFVDNTAANVIKAQAINWAPYQSNSWIAGKAEQHYTMQLMASHNAEGIKGFLSTHGVNSQYAVYSTEKNGEPWHVVLYGDYESHQLASQARENLPDYLTKYSPWIRSFQSIQNTLE